MGGASWIMMRGAPAQKIKSFNHEEHEDHEGVFGVWVWKKGLCLLIGKL